MTIALPAAAFAPPVATVWRRHLVTLAMTAAAILAMFHRDVADLARIWWTSTTFGHCLFILPVVGWLVWQRRAELARLTPVGWAPGLAVVAGGGAVWLTGEAAGVALLRHLAMVALVEGAVLTILGPQVARGLLFPLAYAFFAVPFGDGLEPPLQEVTVALVMPLLHLAGLPAEVDGVLITAGGNVFEVAEACSGAKFVIAMAAFGALVANTCFTAWRRRALFMVAALAVPVLANGLRAFGTIYAAHLTSVAAATGYDHIVYGWLFFGLVMAAVLALAWRWFDRAPDAPAFDPAALAGPVRRRLPHRIGAAAAVAIAGLFLAWGAAVDARADRLPDRLSLPAVPGWQAAPLSRPAPWSPFYPAADHFLIGRYSDGRHAVDVAVAVFAGQREGHELVAFGTGVLREEDVWVRIADPAPLAGGRTMRITAGAVERLVATWYRLADETTASERRVKVLTLRRKLLGGSQRAAALHLSAEGPRAREAIGAFLAAAGDPGALADRVASGGR